MSEKCHPIDMPMLSPRLEFYPDISLKLASVLEEIGVNKRMILKRRRSWLLLETLDKISNTLCNLNGSHLYFGSQSEGTTTEGLDSDADILISNVEYSVLQDLGEWEPGFYNLLMIQEETTPPGYCMLQQLYDDMPTAVTEIQDEHQVRYKGDKVLLKNTYMNQFHRDGDIINGPAGTWHGEGFAIQDYVYSFPFKTLPEFLSIWLQQQIEKGNLSQDMKRYIECNPCYVVPVGRKDSSFKQTEWRISTSHAERCLILSLNITQLQCYIMLKLLLKTYLRHPQEKALSSFMCKNIMLICNGKFHPFKWGRQNLLSVFTHILLQLKQCISQDCCPHFIIHENNLMAHKFTPEVKRWLLEKIQVIYETHGRAFLGIDIDGIGNRLQTRLNTPRHCIVVRDISNNQTRYISGNLLHGLAMQVSDKHILLLNGIISGRTSFNVVLTSLVQLSHQGSTLEQAASRLLTPMVCSSLGSMIASTDIHQYRSVSPEAFTWLLMGLNSDVASSRLKLASVYYCVSDFITTETILRSVEQKYDPSLILAVCYCYEQVGRHPLARFCGYANTHNELAIRHIVAMCVRFIPDEIHCQPKELQYEMYRSTQEERAQRRKVLDFWMDLAVVDSLPYLFFLQYKTYGQLQRFDKQTEALNNLAISIHIIQLSHKETALNLLGQCYQQENRYTEALHCFTDSLTVRPTNNAAKLHICKLLYAIHRNRQMQ